MFPAFSGPPTSLTEKYRRLPTSLNRVHTKGGHATARFLEGFLQGRCFLEGFLEGACKGCLRKDKVLRRVLRRERFREGAQKAQTRHFAEYDPVRVHPTKIIGVCPPCAVKTRAVRPVFGHRS